NEDDADWEQLEGGRSGSVGSEHSAREVGGRPALRDGVIVMMHRLAGRYFFAADGGPVLELPLQGDESNTRTLLDLDDEESVQEGYWFDRDHVHNGGPMNRHDDSVDPQGEHIKAFSGAVVFRVTYAEIEEEEPEGEEGEPTRKLVLRERLLMIDNAGHVEWVDVRANEEEIEIDAVGLEFKWEG